MQKWLLHLIADFMVNLILYIDGRGLKWNKTNSFIGKTSLDIFLSTTHSYLYNLDF